MNPDDYVKGSYQNPYTEEEHQTMKRSGSWCGGWLKESDDSLVYYSPSDVTSTNHGLKTAPYDYGVYLDLVTYGQWLGGWVGTFPNNVCYYTGNNMQYSDGDFVFGGQDNPVPVDVYAEMCSLGLWTGGWVSYDLDHDPYYVGYSTGGNSGGYGCGCGCGSGEGSGYEGGGSYEGSGSNVGVEPGVEIIARNGDVTVSLHWDFQPSFLIFMYFDENSTEGLESFAVLNNLTSSYVLYNDTISAVWDGMNTVSVSGHINYERTTVMTKKSDGSSAGTVKIVRNLFVSMNEVTI